MEENFGQFVIRVCYDKGLDVKKFARSVKRSDPARKAEVSETTISRVARNEIHLSYRLGLDIIEALDLPAEERQVALHLLESYIENFRQQCPFAESGRLLSAVMERLRIPNRTLASKIAVTPSFVSFCKTGQRAIPAAKFNAIAEFLRHRGAPAAEVNRLRALYTYDRIMNDKHFIHLSVRHRVRVAEFALEILTRGAPPAPATGDWRGRVKKRPPVAQALQSKKPETMKL